MNDARIPCAKELALQAQMNEGDDQFNNNMKHSHKC